MRQSSWGSALVVVFGAVSFACGGSAFSTDTDAGVGPGGDSSGGGSGSSSGSSGGGDGGGSSSGGTSSGSGSSGGCDGAACVDGGPASPCPAKEPAPKTACSPSGLECEYGTNPVQDCDSVSTCQTTWQIQDPNDSKCSVTLGMGCPLTFDAVSQGSACTDKSLICNYPRGRCACVEASFGGPVLFVDASTPGRWVCQDPANAACPMPRAPLGSPCAPNGLSCDYGTCNVPGGTGEQCVDGIWKPGAVACPVFAAQ